MTEDVRSAEMILGVAPTCSNRLFMRFLICLLLCALGAFGQCTHTVGMVVSLTGAAGRYGQAASKSVEMAFRDLNQAAGARGIAGCRLAVDLRDDQEGAGDYRQHY